MYYIYKILNLVNGKIYIGKTQTSIEKRFKEHLKSLDDYVNGLYKHQTKLYKAMAKYGIDKFNISVVEEVIDDKQLLNEREKYWIDVYKTIEGGYNISPGGLGGPLFKGHRHSKHSKKLMSDNCYWKTHKQSVEYIERRVCKHRKKVLCLETRVVYESLKEAKKCCGSSVGDSIHSGRRCRGNHFIFLEDNVNITDEFINDELIRINHICEDRELKRVQKRKDTYKNKSDDELKLIKDKTIQSLKLTWQNMPKDKKLKISQDIRKRLKGRKLSQETKLKIGKSSEGRNLGKHWWNNGEKNILSKECPGDGYVRGFLKL